MQHLICVWIQSTMLFCLISGAHCFVEILCIFGVILKLFYGTYCINWGLSKNTCITESICLSYYSFMITRNLTQRNSNNTDARGGVESNEFRIYFHQIFRIFFTFWINLIANFQIELNEFRTNSNLTPPLIVLQFEAKNRVFEFDHE